MPRLTLKKQGAIFIEHIIMMEPITNFATKMLSVTSTPLESYSFHSYLIHLQPLVTLHATNFSSLLQQTYRLPLNHPGLIIPLVPTPTIFLILMLIPHFFR
jgi:hypothetical protein